MPVALKKLTISDLTLFADQFRQHNTIKQKAINLNVGVVADALFPALRAQIDSAPGRAVPLVLTVHGPGAAPPVQWTRKIVRSAGSKNLRLNGELIPSEPARFGGLEANDIAVMVFHGEAVPTAMDLILTTPRDAVDARLWSNASGIIGTASGGMVALEAGRRDELLDGVPETHPVFRLLGPSPSVDDLVEAALGDAQAVERIRRSRGTRPTSAEDLRRARERAAEIGEAGETLVARWLEEEQLAGNVRTFRWASRENAVEPFDFEVQPLLGAIEAVDVKTTSGGFEKSIHLSIAELLECAGSMRPYRIYRVFDLESAPRMRRSIDLRGWAQGLRGALGGLPAGVSPEGFAIDPASLGWEQEEVRLPGDDGPPNEEAA